MKCAIWQPVTNPTLQPDGTYLYQGDTFRRYAQDEMGLFAQDQWRLTPTFTGVSYEKLDKLGSIQWPCNDKAEEGTPTMHIGEFVRGKGLFRVTPYVPTDEVTTRMYPLLLTTGPRPAI